MAGPPVLHGRINPHTPLGPAWEIAGPSPPHRAWRRRGEGPRRPRPGPRPGDCGRMARPRQTKGGGQGPGWVDKPAAASGAPGSELRDELGALGAEQEQRKKVLIPSRDLGPGDVGGAWGARSALRPPGAGPGPLRHSVRAPRPARGPKRLPRPCGSASRPKPPSAAAGASGRPRIPIRAGSRACRRARLQGTGPRARARGRGVLPALPAPAPPALTLTAGARTPAPREQPGAAWGLEAFSTRTLRGRFGFSENVGGPAPSRARAPGPGAEGVRALSPSCARPGQRGARRRSRPREVLASGARVSWPEGLAARRRPPVAYARQTAPGLRSAPLSRGAGAGGPKPSWP